MPFVKLLYPLLGVYWLAALLVLIFWRRQICRDQVRLGFVARPVAYSRELESRVRYFKLLFWILVLAFIPAYTVLSYARFRGPWAAWLFSVFGGVLTLLGLVNAYKHLKAIHRLRIEREGQLLVATGLQKITSFDDHLFHDLPTSDGSCIDRVLVGRSGVVALVSYVADPGDNVSRESCRKVKVKGQTLTFPFDPSHANSRLTANIGRKARWLETWLATEAREFVTVRPVLVLPGWRIDVEKEGLVTVLNEGELQGLRAGKRRLPPEQIHRIAEQLEKLSRASGVDPLRNPELPEPGAAPVKSRMA